MQHTSSCKNCGFNLVGKFCSNCGEKVYTEKDKTIKSIFHEVVHFFTHFDGSFLTTLKTVFTSPGKFSADYCSGNRKKYFKPVSFFFVIVILYLLFPRFQGLNMRLGTYVDKAYNFTWVSVPLVKAKMKAHQATYVDVAKEYDHKSSSISKIGLFFIIPLSAGFALLLFFRTRKYFFDHFIISLEVSAIFIALHFLIVPFISFIAELINKDWVRFFADGNYWLEYFLVTLYLFIVSVAFKRFYNEKWIWIIPKSLVYLFIFNFIVLYVYRLIVLVVTLLLI